jgi:hypothetical protein
MSITQKLIEIQNEVDQREARRRELLMGTADKISRLTVGHKEALMVHVRKISDLLSAADNEFQKMAKTIGALGADLLDVDAEIRSYTVSDDESSGEDDGKVKRLRARKTPEISA